MVLALASIKLVLILITYFLVSMEMLEGQTKELVHANLMLLAPVALPLRF
jgi:hypothetical protein